MRVLRPKSATAAVTGICGLIGGGLTIYLIRDWGQPGHIKTLAVLAVVALAMIAVETGWYGAHRNQTTGLARAPINPFRLDRFIRKLMGFWVTLAALAATYWLLPEYASDFFQPFFDAVGVTLPFILIGAPFYFYYIDRRQAEPEDSYSQLGRLIGGTLPDNWTALAQHARGWAIKGFFLPLMFVLLHNHLQELWNGPSLLSIESFVVFYERMYGMLLMVDVLFATIGYIFTLRLLDTHIRSAEPTMFGWVVCLICYAPFWQLSRSYFAYDDDIFWGGYFRDLPAVYVAWGSVILLLIGIYAYATVAFGLRFSNLTHRGIITNGPYGWVKHPAYLTKNLSYWMISIPFISAVGWTDALRHCLLLGLVNGIYVMRAITEERHLARDPEYRAYQAYIREHGLWARVRRLLSRQTGFGDSPTPAE